MNTLLSSNIANVLHSVNEKIQSGIRERYQTTNKTPWGYVRVNETIEESSSPEMDSCKELHSGNISTDVSPDKETSSFDTIIARTESKAKKDGIARVVISENQQSADISLIRPINHDHTKYKSNDSSNTTVNQPLESCKDKRTVFFTSKLDAIGDKDFSDDIVFRPKVRKPKKRRGRSHTDTDSISSNDSVSRVSTMMSMNSEGNEKITDAPLSATIAEKLQNEFSR